MREWQNTKEGGYVMPYAVYYQSIWAVRDLARMEEELKAMRCDAADIRTSSFYKCKGKEPQSHYSQVESRVISPVILEWRIEAIRNALSVVPDEFKEIVLLNITEKKKFEYPDKAERIWKQRFLFNVAKNLSLI